MSEVRWICWQSRGVGKGMTQKAVVTAPDLESAITLLATTLGHHHSQFARRVDAWDKSTQPYFVQSAASHALGRKANA